MAVNSSRWLGGALVALSSLACAEAVDSRSARADELRVEAPEVETMRVLVTGFNDWKALGTPPKVWRCRENPSCRLLVGAEVDQQPASYAGPLVARLREAAPAIEWRFATMPVTWEVFAEVPRDVDLIINLGLGVYDRFDTLQLEAGAYNLRRGADAAGAEPATSEAMSTDAGEVLAAPADSAIATRIDALAGQTIAGYEVTVAEAREANSYLCNETHFRALSALHEELEPGHEGGGRLREVYFLHIPYARDNDYEALADGVAGLVLGILDGRGAASAPDGQRSEVAG